MRSIELKLTNGSHVKEGDFEVISEVYFNLSSNIHFAKKIGKLSHIDNPQVVRRVVERLDDRLQSKWHAIWTGKRQSKIPRLKNLKEFLQKEMDAARSRIMHNPQAYFKDQFDNARPNQAEEIMDVAPSRALKSATRRQTRGAGLATKTNVEPWKRGEECRLCADSHRIVLCPVFKSLSPEQRRCVAAVQQRCFLCLKDNHIARDCKAKPLRHQRL